MEKRIGSVIVENRMARIAFRALLLRERFNFPIVEAMVARVSTELCGRDKARPALEGRGHPTSPIVTLSLFHRTIVEIRTQRLKT
jgi:hypothetical protein